MDKSLSRLKRAFIFMATGQLNRASRPDDTNVTIFSALKWDS